jgi:hypothetical protein
MHTAQFHGKTVFHGAVVAGVRELAVRTGEAGDAGIKTTQEELDRELAVIRTWGPVQPRPSTNLG